MKLKKIEFAGKEIWPFTIPSGIIMTDLRCAKRLAERIPYLGLLSLKTTGVNERVVPERYEVEHPAPGKEYGNRECVFAQVGEASEETFVNAIRLVNPGKDKMKVKIIETDFQKDRVINQSVFGGTIQEFVSVIHTLDDVVDCFDGNYGCPHSEKGGKVIGTDPKTIYEFTKACVSATRKPFIAKLTPNVPRSVFKDCVRAAYEAGAYGIAFINTIGLYIHQVDGHNVLWSKIGGGLSGKGVKQRALECTRDAREVLPDNYPVIVMGGIGTASDIREFEEAGRGCKLVYGIGTRLIGMTEDELAEYFPTLVRDLENGTNKAESLLKKIDMSYKKIRIEKIVNNGCDFKVYRTNARLECSPGQFVFAWIPGIGEKPFSIMDDDPLTLGVLTRGYFTERFNSLKNGDEFYIRGPHGNGVNVSQNSKAVLVGGGCGIAGLYLLAKKFSKKINVTSLLGAKDKKHLPYLDEFKKCGETYIATEDGSLGIKGNVADLFRYFGFPNSNLTFFNCGPRAMINAVLPLELNLAKPDNIYSSIDYITRCGVGICGSCADEKGRRTCVEGVFISL